MAQRTAAERYQDGRYLQVHPEWHDGDAGWKAAEVRQVLRDEGLAPATVCDVGCGTGGVLAALRHDLPGVRLVGLEPSPQAVAEAARLHPEVDVVQGTVEVVEERFDLVMALDVIEHVEDYFTFLRSLHPLGDCFLFHIPLDMTVSAVARMRPIVLGREHVGHLHPFSRETALAALRETGYVVDSERYTPVAFGVATQRRTALLHLPRRLGMVVAPHLTVRVLGGFSLLVLAHVA